MLECRVTPKEMNEISDNKLNRETPFPQRLMMYAENKMKEHGFDLDGQIEQFRDFKTGDLVIQQKEDE